MTCLPNEGSGSFTLIVQEEALRENACTPYPTSLITMAHGELTLQNVLISCALIGLAWRLLKFFAKHPFDNLPGPPSPSIFFGLSRHSHIPELWLTPRFTTGNIKQLQNPQAWEFHQTLADNYGQVVKYRGLGNVSVRPW